jgi:DNA phosphorothioation-associated putative methyltransferase
LDVRDLFGSYKEAVTQADRLLFAAGDRAVVDASARAATIGKLTGEALYVHLTVLEQLPPALRVYEGCARALAGSVEGATILKLHRQKAQVSYLSYPSFDRDPHPALETAVIARLAKLDITFRDFRTSDNPPILHRKEAFVDADYPGRPKFERLTLQEDRADLLSDHNIGTRLGWEDALARSGYYLAGHRLCRVRPT